MAHECPECGSLCHCGTDIDDILLNAPSDIASCGCCVDLYDQEDDEGAFLEEEMSEAE